MQLLNLTIAILLLALLLPLLLGRELVALAQTKRLFDRLPRVGQSARRGKTVGSLSIGSG